MADAAFLKGSHSHKIYVKKRHNWVQCGNRVSAVEQWLKQVLSRWKKKISILIPFLFDINVFYTGLPEYLLVSKNQENAV